jgi:pilus assembly protein CpaC
MRASAGRLACCLIAVLGPAYAWQASEAPRELSLRTGKSVVLDSQADIKRVSVANEDVLQAVAISPREVVLNGKAAGETTVILWRADGGRLFFNVTVDQPDRKLEALRQQLRQETGTQEVTASIEGESVFLRGTVPDLLSAERAARIAATFGKPVNLLRVKIPPTEAQVLLKVRFASVNRTVLSQLGANFFSTGAGNNIGSVTTGQFSPPSLSTIGPTGAATQFTLSDALNILLFRPDLNFGATLKLLEQRGAVEILAEPNLLTSSGKEASFLAGGEFPFPVVQGAGAGGVAAVTIQFREFGVRLRFFPVLTPRNTIQMRVAPEVSSLDYSNGITLEGVTVPGIASRKVSTDIELQDGQSFAIAGLLDNRVTETLSKVPGLGNIPWLGKLFQSRDRTRSNTELLVLVSPEIVRPIPKGQTPPGIKFPEPFLPGGAAQPPRTPGIDVTGPAAQTPSGESVPIESLLAKSEKTSPAEGEAAPAVTSPAEQNMSAPDANPLVRPAPMIAVPQSGSQTPR